MFILQFKTIVAQTFIDHLRRVHRTNPALVRLVNSKISILESQAGLVLRCQCGNESFSSNHSKKVTFTYYNSLLTLSII